MFNVKSNSEIEIKRSHFKNLVSLALIDKALAPEEIDLLRNLGQKHGLEEDEIHTLLFSKSELGTNHPENGKEKIIYLYDLVKMMLIDGTLSENELEFCLRIAKVYGYGHDLISAMVNTIAAGSFPEEARGKIFASLEKFMAQRK